MSFIAIIPDKFEKVTRDEAATSASKRMADVRRPTRGIQLKEDSYATIRILKEDGTPIFMYNGGARDADKDWIMGSENYSNFMIQSITEERIEKQQIVETFGESFIFFFGERPRILAIQGVLLNTFDFNWEAEWWKNYDEYLRGSRCVANKARVYLTYDETMVVGYIMATGSTKQAVEKNHVPFQFQMFVTDYVQLSQVGDPDADQTFTKPVTRAELNSQGRAGSYIGQLSPFRPAAVKKLQFNAGFSVLGFVGQMATNIASAVQGTVTGARATARSLANMANMPAAYLDLFLDNPVRVPMGFAGAIVFDDLQVNLMGAEGAAYPAALGQPIQYTVFGDNADEFVALAPFNGDFSKSTNAYYASASVEFGNKLAQPFSEVSNAKWINAVTSKAYKQWRSWGLIPPDDIFSRSLQLLASNPYGMKLLRTAKNAIAPVGAKISGAMNAALDQAEQKIMPIVAGSQMVLGGIATADRIRAEADRALSNYDRAPSSTFGQTQQTAGVGGQAPPTLGAAIDAANQTQAPAQQTMGDALVAAGLAQKEAEKREQWTAVGPVTNQDQRPIPSNKSAMTLVSAVPSALLPAQANQLLLNPLQSPEVAKLAFQTLQPLTSAPIPTTPINNFSKG